MIYTIERFAGLVQNVDEHLIPATASPDALNMETGDGALSVAAGYVPYAPAPPGGARSLAVYYRRAGGETQARLLALCPGGVYEYQGGAWLCIHQGAGDAPLSAVNYQMNGQDVILLCDGTGAVMYYDGEAVHALPGAPAGATLLTLHMERVWASGVEDAPDSVYYSRAFAPDDWSGNPDSPESGGGEIQLPTFNGGRILALRNLFDDVLVFKQRDLYRIVGTYPGNYEVVRVHGVVGPLARESIVSGGDRVFFLSGEGLCVYNGVTALPVTAQPARRFFDRICRQSAHKACAVIHKNRLILAAPLDGSSENNALLVMDLASGSCMERSGVSARCFLTLDEELLFAGADGAVYRLDEGSTYDGAPIEAYWRTPWTDLGNQTYEKYLDSLFLIGRGTLEVVCETDRHRSVHRLRLGETERPARVKLCGHGRRFRLTLRNVEGSAFCVRDGLCLTADDQL